MSEDALEISDGVGDSTEDEVVDGEDKTAFAADAGVTDFRLTCTCDIIESRSSLQDEDEVVSVSDAIFNQVKGEKEKSNCFCRFLSRRRQNFSPSFFFSRDRRLFLSLLSAGMNVYRGRKGVEKVFYTRLRRRQRAFDYDILILPRNCLLKSDEKHQSVASGRNVERPADVVGLDGLGEYFFMRVSFTSWAAHFRMDLHTDRTMLASLAAFSYSALSSLYHSICLTVCAASTLEIELGQRLHDRNAHTARTALVAE